VTCFLKGELQGKRRDEDITTAPQAMRAVAMHPGFWLLLPPEDRKRQSNATLSQHGVRPYLSNFGRE
jgi:hypothetical protein